MSLLMHKSRLLSSIFTYANIHRHTILVQLGLISIGVLILFTAIAMVFWELGPDPSWFFTTSVGYLSILSFFVFFVELFFIIANISGFIFFQCARKLNGTGSFQKTCTALIRTAVFSFIPVALCFNLIFLKKILGALVAKMAAFAFIAFILYGIIAIIRTIAKVHDFNFGRGMKVFLLGFLIQSPVLFSIIYIIVTHFRELFIFLVPFSVQILTIIVLIAIGFKILEKLKSKSRS